MSLPSVKQTTRTTRIFSTLTSDKKRIRPFHPQKHDKRNHTSVQKPPVCSQQQTDANLQMLADDDNLKHSSTHRRHKNVPRPSMTSLSSPLLPADRNIPCCLRAPSRGPCCLPPSAHDPLLVPRPNMIVAQHRRHPLLLVHDPSQ